MHRARILAAAPLLVACVACGGGGGTPAPAPAAPTFTLAVSPTSLQVPAGGTGVLAVTVNRLNGFKGDIALTGVGLPVGVSASGLVPDGATSFQLPLVVGVTTAQTTFQGLSVEGRSGTQVASAGFTLTVQAPLHPAQVGVDGAAAAGGHQTGGVYAQQVVVREPLAATTAANSSGTVQVRHGFLPSGSSQN